jgi:adenylosuccinate synthase
MSSSSSPTSFSLCLATAVITGVTASAFSHWFVCRSLLTRNEQLNKAYTQLLTLNTTQIRNRGDLKVILGVQWGDEGKGKIALHNSMFGEFQFIARAVGGPNAGHTAVYRGKRFKFHQCPVGILNPALTCILGNGMVIDLVRLEAELKDVEDLMKLEHDAHLFTREAMQKRIRISHAAHLIFSFHKQMDANMEKLREKKVGTTNTGVGPAYQSKTLRIGVQFQYLAEEKYTIFEEKYRNEVKQLMQMFHSRVIDVSEQQMEDELRSFQSYRAFAQASKCDCGHLIRERIVKGEKGLIEGANSPMLSFDQGMFPNVTSTDTGIGGTLGGLMIEPCMIGEVHGVMKPYVTRVGEGPRPGQMPQEIQDLFRKQGKERGTTTGRDRDCMYFDVEQVKDTVQKNGITSLSLVKVDMWSGKGKIRIGVRYKKGDGRMPVMTEMMENAELVYEDLEGWTEDISAIRRWCDLPEACQNFVLRIQELVGVKIEYIGVGEELEALIKVEM